MTEVDHFLPPVDTLKRLCHSRCRVGKSLRLRPSAKGSGSSCKVPFTVFANGSLSLASWLEFDLTIVERGSIGIMLCFSDFFRK